MSARLSILICTIPERTRKLHKLLEHLRAQISTHPVHIHTDPRPRAEVSVGAKRQSLLESAQGDYVVYIDDDDWVADSYVQKIIEATESGPDCIGFLIAVKGLAGTAAIASRRYPTWANNVDGYDYVRSTYHKTPVKREHALAIGFKDMRFAEDHDYSQRLIASGLLKTEVFIHEQLYHYRYEYEDPKVKYGL
jgi:glycosyltransferase involved in cell wall biosynthesis